MLAEEQVRNLLPEYLFGGLDGGLSEQIAVHLKVCPACQEELRAYGQVLDDLPLALSEARPHPVVKQRLMAAVASQALSAEEDTTTPWWRVWSDRVYRKFPAWSLVSLALVVLLAISNLLLWQQSSQIDTQDQAGLQIIHLSGTENALSATGSIVISTDGEYGTLVVDGLRSLSADLQYQLWLIKDGKRTSGGVFSVDESGYASLEIHAPRPVGEYPAFGVTIEPYGGSPGPTGDKVLGGEA